MMMDGADPVTPEAATVFEPIMPSTESLAGFGIILILCVVVANVWAEQVVPVSRTKLAISKSRGEVKEYLDELRASDPSLVNATATGDLDGAGNTSDMAVSNSSKDNNSSNRSFERWLFTDWLEDNKSERKGGRQKEPALPVLKDAKWNSGDNPVLAASALLGAGILFSAIVERWSPSGTMEEKDGANTITNCKNKTTANSGIQWTPTCSDR
eukprot:scaffold12369_cov97-Cylindrotheca_fusiformis.AAC.8